MHRYWKQSENDISSLLQFPRYWQFLGIANDYKIIASLLDIEGNYKIIDDILGDERNWKILYNFTFDADFEQY